MVRNNHKCRAIKVCFVIYATYINIITILVFHVNFISDSSCFPLTDSKAQPVTAFSDAFLDHCDWLPFSLFSTTFFSKCKCLCVSTHFKCFQAWNMILVKLTSFSRAEYLINVNISYRIPYLLVITGVFVFIVLKGNTCFCHFAHIICLWLLLDFVPCWPDPVFSFWVCFCLALTKFWSLNTFFYTLMKVFLTVAYQLT